MSSLTTLSVGITVDANGNARKPVVFASRNGYNCGRFPVFRYATPIEPLSPSEQPGRHFVTNL